jgi:RNA polymerase sigma factor (TIGR02999 family)
METVDPAEITRLLQAWGHGDRTALDALTPRVYDALRRMARRHMQNERVGQTLQATALVNEVYLRLVDVAGANWQDRAHFFAVMKVQKCGRLGVSIFFN